MPKTNHRVVKPLQTLTRLREVINLRQKELCEVLDCSLDTVKSLEQGRLRLSESLGLKISLETGVDLQWLMNNDLAVPILRSGATMFKNWQAEKESVSKKYDIETYHWVRARKSALPDLFDIHFAQLASLPDYCQWRAIYENARTRKLHVLARYKFNKFIKEMEEEFGSDPEVFTLPADLPGRWSTAVKFVEAELASSKRQLEVMNDDRPYTSLSAEEIRASNDFFDVMNTTSPYGKAQKPSNVFRGKKSVRTQ